jgi:hypothetical protein
MMGPLNRDNFDGFGIDISAEFRKLPEDKRFLGDCHSLITGVIPAAVWMVRLSFEDSDSADSAGHRIAAACRQLSEDESGDRQLWQAAFEMFEMTSKNQTNAEQLLLRVREIEGQDESQVALRVLGYMLATRHASVDEAIHCHLSCIDILMKWFDPTGTVHQLILLPYIESYWKRAASEFRFTFLAPDLTISAIEAAMTAPESDRIRAVLSAAVGGFRIRGLEEAVRNLQKPIPKASPPPL